MSQVYPLKFAPIFKRRIWGGRALESMLGKRLPPDEPIGESWELADLEHDQSVVAEGPKAGAKLGQLVREWGRDLIGRAELFDGRFPLLIKFLDAREVLSVQVHPDKDYVDRHGGAAHVKHEAWYVLHAEPGGCIYRGLKPGVDRAQFEAAVETGTTQELLHRIPAKPGQCHYLPSGTIHALGAGVVVAEIQTPSDTTFRVFDWNRVESATGQPRDLHLVEALECIHFDQQDTKSAQQRSHVASVWTAVTRLITCPYFTIEKVRMVRGTEQDIPYAEPVVWMVLKGAGAVQTRSSNEELKFTRGDTVLLPAALRDARVRIDEDCAWLEITLPSPSDLADLDQPSRQALRESDPSAGDKPFQIGIERKTHRPKPDAS